MHQPARSSLTRAAQLALATCIAVVVAGCGDPPAPQAPAAPPTQVAAVKTPPPVYPLELACQGVSGKVTLTLNVGVDGRPSDVRVSQGSGNDALDRIAVDGVQDWQFRAATRNGVAIEQRMEVPLNFRPPQVRPDECFALDAGT